MLPKANVKEGLDPECAPLRRILVVEDDKIAANALGRLLHMKGYEVQTANDGLTALEAAEETPPDVVLLDIGLPMMDGYEVARRLRKLQTALRPLLIAITGYGKREQVHESYNSGIDLHLTKPVEFNELCAFLDRYKSIMKPRVAAR